jgi:hypothetical protein
MAHTTKWEDKFVLGKVDGRNIYLSAPSWDCSWYWGFGYLGNKDCHYHLSGLTENEWYDTEKECWRSEKFNLYDGIKKHFGDTLTITDEKDLWTFCELVSSAYKLKETAGVLGLGGSNYTTNPVTDIIKNEIETARINEKVLPAIFDALNDLLIKYK